jgi:hypothetical protein
MIQWLLEDDMPHKLIFWEKKKGDNKDDKNALLQQGKVKHQLGTGIVLRDSTAHGTPTFDYYALPDTRNGGLVMASAGVSTACGNF